MRKAVCVCEREGKRERVIEGGKKDRERERDFL